ncbi:MAG TPA: hypothetical protein VN420_01950 [Candidatus Fimivivens sp.]|nr:hypothetical protein [Candidatus Fimivivens sp.]
MTSVLQQMISVPKNIREMFISDDILLYPEESCLLYGLPEEVIPATTRPLGSIFIKETPLDDYPKLIAGEAKVSPEVAYGVAYEVNQRIFLKFPEYFTDAVRLGKEWEAKKSAPTVSLEEAKKKVFELEPWLLEKDEDEEEAAEEQALVEASREKLPLLSAIGKYPRLGEQQISTERIRVKNQSDPARPTLANWIRVYRDELGIGYHDPMTRGKFIFDSENGKRLKPEERERLNVVLRSIEENVSVDIDPEKPEIVFPAFVAVPASAASPVLSRSAIIPSHPVTPAQPSAPLTRASVSGSPVSAPAHQAGVPVPSQKAASVPPQAPPRKPVSFAPAPPADLPVGGGAFSFSSSHSLPVESEGEGDFAIRHLGAEPLPSGRNAFGSPTPPVSAHPSAAMQDMNPFHIHPVSTQRKSEEDGNVGRVVDLRN